MGRAAGLGSAARISAIACVIGGSWACSKSESGSAPSASSEPDDNRQALVARDDRLAKLFQAVPASAEPLDKPCPDAKIAKALKGDPGRLVVVERRFLERFLRPESDCYSGSGAKFKGLTTPAFRILKPAARASTKQQVIDALWNAKKLERDYTHVGVLQAKTRRGPVLQGDKYEGGVFAGTLFIVEMGKVGVLCQAAVQAQSSEAVAAKAGASGADAAWADYISRLRSAVHAGVRRVSKQLEVDIE